MTGSWFKGKRFDEKQRLLFESGEENRGSVDFRLDASEKKFQFEMIHKHTKWECPTEAPPNGSLKILRSKTVAKGSFKILKSKKGALSGSNKNLASDMNTRLLRTETEILCCVTNLRCCSRDTSTIFGFLKSPNVKEYSILQKLDFLKTLAKFLEIKEENLIKGASDIVAQYLPVSFWFSVGKLHPAIVHDLLSFRVTLRDVELPRRTRRETSVPIPLYVKKFENFLDRGIEALDEVKFVPQFDAPIFKDRTEDHQLGVSRKNDPRTNLEALAFHLRVRVK
eukprot:CAMPEP_0184478258 /NCGR_PEP_ID=MMETSP0113_2-20130426/324_1 /TAXON_ID=91329 /ORGANISM="Norrisiella sphaerica, Strain BC52" /LENGTH=280 /DNA_ID=CAMNT_0026855969 /DNA_START=97 /DNA_END=939 /DNA_ORIENTATION=+